MKRGDVVLVEVPYLSGGQSKRRPALVLLADSYNQKLRYTIIAAISSRVGKTIEATHYLLDPNTQEGKQSGVHILSMFRCDRIFTVEQGDVTNVIGSLSESSMRGVEKSLKTALGIN